MSRISTAILVPVALDITDKLFFTVIFICKVVIAGTRKPFDVVAVVVG